MFDFFVPVPGSPYYDGRNDFEEGEESMSTKLYTLTDQYNNLWELVDNEADLQIIEDTLQGLEGDISDKVENIVKLIKEIESDEVKIKSEETRLRDRRQAMQNRRESIKNYMESCLVAMGLEKVKTPLFTVSIQNNPASVLITDEEKFKATLLIFYGNLYKFYSPKEPELRKTDLAAALKSGEVYPGVSMQQTKSLRIR